MPFNSVARYNLYNINYTYLMYIGRIPGYKRSDIQLLPVQSTKIKIYEEYVKASGALTFRLPGERAFRMLWQKYMPQLIITAPRSDLCWTCQRNSMALVAASNKSDVEKMKVFKSRSKLYS